jgi:hypothetical protein
VTNPAARTKDPRGGWRSGKSEKTETARYIRRHDVSVAEFEAFADCTDEPVYRLRHRPRHQGRKVCRDFGHVYRGERRSVGLGYYSLIRCRNCGHVEWKHYHWPGRLTA